MKRHLSSEEIARWTLGDHIIEIEQHLSDCSSCRTEVASFEATLSSFREMAHTYADGQCAPDDHTLRRIRQAPYRSLVNRLSVSAVAALVCLFAVLSIERHRAVSELADAKMDDAVLLQSVKQDLSDTLPTSLAPLRGVVSWERAETAVTR